MSEPDHHLMEKLCVALVEHEPRWRIAEIIAALQFECVLWADLPPPFKEARRLPVYDSGIDCASLNGELAIQVKSRSRDGQVRWDEVAKFLAAAKLSAIPFKRLILVLDGYPRVSKVLKSLYEVRHLEKAAYFVALARQMLGQADMSQSVPLAPACAAAPPAMMCRMRWRLGPNAPAPVVATPPQSPTAVAVAVASPAPAVKEAVALPVPPQQPSSCAQAYSPSMPMPAGHPPPPYCEVSCCVAPLRVGSELPPGGQAKLPVDDEEEVPTYDPLAKSKVGATGIVLNARPISGCLYFAVDGEPDRIYRVAFGEKTPGGDL